MDIVFIEGLRIDTVIGVYDWERRIRQTLTLDLELGWDCQQAAQTDDVQYALDYKQVSDRLIAEIEGSEFALLEALAARLVTVLQTEFQIPWLRLRLGKSGAVSAAASVGLVIERGSRG